MSNTSQLLVTVAVSHGKSRDPLRIKGDRFQGPSTTSHGKRSQAFQLTPCFNWKGGEGVRTPLPLTGGGPGVAPAGVG
jgi:hypothetical protein